MLRGINYRATYIAAYSTRRLKDIMFSADITEVRRRSLHRLKDQAMALIDSYDVVATDLEERLRTLTIDDTVVGECGVTYADVRWRALTMVADSFAMMESILAVQLYAHELVALMGSPDEWAEIAAVTPRSVTRAWRLAQAQFDRVVTDVRKAIAQLDVRTLNK
jgi:uncharacterized membrane protein (DUF485 family)